MSKRPQSIASPIGRGPSPAKSSAVVVKASDLERIKTARSSVSNSSDKAERHQASLDRVKGWTNTLEATRLLKLEAYKAKLAKEEEARQAVDREEAAYQAQQRAEAIGRANQLRYFEQDKVKTFHSALLAADVYKERELQIELKARRRAAAEEREEIWALRALEAAQEEEAERAAAAESRRKHIEEQKRLMDEQLREKEQRKIEEAEIARKELEVLQRQAEEFHQRAAEKVAASKARERASRLEAIAIDGHHARLRAEAAAAVRDEERRIEEYGKEKARIDMMRKARAEEVFNAKQATKAALFEAQAAQVSALYAEESRRLAAEQALRETQQQERIEREAVSRAKTLSDIQKNHALQRERLAAERAREKEVEAETLRLATQQAQEYEAAEVAKKAKARENALKLQAYHKAQMEVHKLQRDADLVETAAYVQQLVDNEAEEDRRLHEYATAVAQDAYDNGRSLKPLLHATRKSRSEFSRR